MSIRHTAGLMLAIMFCLIWGDRITAQAQSMPVTTIHAFIGPEGAYPYAALIQASDGNFYGTTEGGGTNLYGTVFRLVIGQNPAPVLSSLSPSSANAGGPAFTLTLKGKNFLATSGVNWTAGGITTPLTTTYVSATELKATVPAALIASPGKATVTVVTPGPGGGTSAGKNFTINLTTLKLTAASLVQNVDGSYTATMTLKNSGYLSASAVTIKKSALGAAATSTTLPLSVGSIAAGSTAAVSLSYPGSAGVSGTKVKLAVSGTFTAGTFSGSLTVTLP